MWAYIHACMHASEAASETHVLPVEQPEVASSPEEKDIRDGTSLTIIEAIRLRTRTEQSSRSTTRIPNKNRIDESIFN
jgi:hypothetical protein